MKYGDWYLTKARSSDRKLLHNICWPASCWNFYLNFKGLVFFFFLVISSIDQQLKSECDFIGYWLRWILLNDNSDTSSIGCLSSFSSLRRPTILIVLLKRSCGEFRLNLTFKYWLYTTVGRCSSERTETILTVTSLTLSLNVLKHCQKSAEILYGHTCSSDKHHPTLGAQRSNLLSIQTKVA